MLGAQDMQGDLFRTESLYADFVGEQSIYTWLAFNASKYFSDKRFAIMYSKDNGRPSVPPSQMMVLMFLQFYCNVSDAEAIQRAQFDIRWKVALRIHLDEKLCGKTCLQLFRARVQLHVELREILISSIVACKNAGLIKNKKINVATDTTPIIGRGAVKDTYNLLADAITNLLRIGAKAEEIQLSDFAKKLDLSRYLDRTSIKGLAEIDWGKSDERNAFLNELVVDAQRALRWGRAALSNSSLPPEFNAKICEAVELLNKIVIQDVVSSERVESKENKTKASEKNPKEAPLLLAEDLKGPVEIKDGVAKDRIPAAHDPEQRHGRKSKSKRFDGHKGSITVETQSGVILDTSVQPGNSEDSRDHLESVLRAEKNYQEAVELSSAGGTEQEACEVGKAYGDCAYGTAKNRRAFESETPELHAKQATLYNGGRFTKNDFPKNIETDERICPAGKRATSRKVEVDWDGRRVEVNEYKWDSKDCEVCPLRKDCIKESSDESNSDKSKKRRKRVIRDHPEEALLARAREQQARPEYKQAYKERQLVEQRLARLVQLGGRQARYKGKAKTGFQWLLLAIVSNFAKAAATIASTIVQIIVLSPNMRPLNPKISPNLRWTITVISIMLKARSQPSLCCAM
jgi:hypothetical protein